MSSEENLGFHERGVKFPATPSLQSRIFPPQPRRTGSCPCPQCAASFLDLRALIANLELEFNLSSIRINNLKFSNRKFLAISYPEFQPGSAQLPASTIFIPSIQPPVSSFQKPSTLWRLIVTPRLGFHATARKQTPPLISNRCKTPVFFSRASGVAALFSRATNHE